MKNMSVSEKELQTISNILEQKGSVLAFPTDTVWGLGCMTDDEEAVKKIYAIKERDKDKPLILLGSQIEYLLPFVAVLPENAEKIINKYFPGPVTLVLPKSKLVPDFVTAGMATVGIRISDCEPFIEILEKSVKIHVLATTSANISGEPPCLSKNDVENTLKGKLDYILDDYGYTPSGTASTVVSVNTNGDVKILRQGNTKIEIQEK